MGCVNIKGLHQEKYMSNQNVFVEKQNHEIKLETQQMKLKTRENLSIQTVKTWKKNSKYEEKSSKTQKKIPEYLSESEHYSLKDIKLSLMPAVSAVSEIHGQHNTESAHQTIQNLFYKSLQIDLNPFDRRFSIKESFIYPYNCIGMLFYCVQTNKQKSNREYFYFTAFLLSPTLIMTSANAFIPYAKESIVMPLKFLIREKETQTLKSIFTKARLITKIMKPERPKKRNPQDLTNNFCLLELQSRIEREKYLSLGCQFRIQGEAQIFGYPMNNLILQCQKGERENLFGMKGDTKINQLCIQYDIDTSPGQQGAPILISPIQGDYCVIGIHSGYIQKEVQFQKNTNILDILANSTFMKTQLKVNIGTHFTKKTLSQLKKWSEELISINEIQFIDFLNFQPQIFAPFKQKMTKKEKKMIQNEDKDQEYQSSPIPIVKQLEKAQKFYSNWEPHQSLKMCLRASRYLPQQNQYFAFKINFLFALNYLLLFQLQTALMYFNKCFQFTSKGVDKGMEHIIQQIDLFNNMSIVYLLKGDMTSAKQFLRRAEALVKANQLFSHNAEVGILITKGIIEKQMKNIAKALSNFQQALRIFNKIKSNQRAIERHRIITILQNISQCHYMLKNQDKWALTGLQCLKKMQDIHLIQRIFQLQWFQNFLNLLTKEKHKLSPECQFVIAKEISNTILSCIEKNTEEFKKKLLSGLRLLKRQKLLNFQG